MKGWVFYAALPAVCWAMFAHQPVAWAQMMINNATVASCPTTQLPKTGYDFCEAEWGAGVIPCPGTGMDAEYADPEGRYDYGSPRGAPSYAEYKASRFANNGDGTVTDMATGLMWVSNPGAAGRGGTYNWTNAINASENLTYATYSDWRLPNIFELQSIVDLGTYGASIDESIFPGVSGDPYWSSTTSLGNTTYALYQDFYNGGIYSDWLKANMSYIIPVRSRQ